MSFEDLNTRNILRKRELRHKSKTKQNCTTQIRTLTRQSPTITQENDAHTIQRRTSIINGTTKESVNKNALLAQSRLRFMENNRVQNAKRQEQNRSAARPLEISNLSKYPPSKRPTPDMLVPVYVALMKKTA
jgi:hypothetical protein